MPRHSKRKSFKRHTQTKGKQSAQKTAKKNPLQIKSETTFRGWLSDLLYYPMLFLYFTAAFGRLQSVNGLSVGTPSPDLNLVVNDTLAFSANSQDIFTSAAPYTVGMQA